MDPAREERAFSNLFFFCALSIQSSTRGGKGKEEKGLVERAKYEKKASIEYD